MERYASTYRLKGKGFWERIDSWKEVEFFRAGSLNDKESSGEQETFRKHRGVEDFGIVKF